MCADAKNHMDPSLYINTVLLHWKKLQNSTVLIKLLTNFLMEETYHEEEKSAVNLDEKNS